MLQANYFQILYTFTFTHFLNEIYQYNTNDKNKSKCRLQIVLSKCYNKWRKSFDVLNCKAFDRLLIRKHTLQFLFRF